MMSDIYNEPVCAKCIHLNVCKYKEEYIDLVNQMRNQTISLSDDNEKKSLKSVRDVDFVKFQDPLCKYYSNTYPEFVRKHVSYKDDNDV